MYLTKLVEVVNHLLGCGWLVAPDSNGILWAIKGEQKLTPYIAYRVQTNEELLGALHDLTMENGSGRPD